MEGKERRNKEKEQPQGDSGKERKDFWKTFLVAYGLMLLLYLYFLCANLSMAPKYVYTQF